MGSDRELIKEFVKLVVLNEQPIDVVPTNTRTSFSALVLSKADHDALLSSLNDKIDFGWDVIAHHVTLNLGNYKGNRTLIGQTFPINVVSFASDNLVCAVGVQLPPEVVSVNQFPHITIAVNRQHGGKPVLSNKLNWNEAEALPSPIIVHGTLMEVTEANKDKYSDEY